MQAGEQGVCFGMGPPEHPVIRHHQQLADAFSFDVQVTARSLVSLAGMTSLIALNLVCACADMGLEAIKESLVTSGADIQFPAVRPEWSIANDALDIS